jgi:hypothetical protein
VTSAGRPPKNDMVEAARTHRRWLANRSRYQEADTYRDEWWAEQCGACRWWIPLSGALGNDYGACANPASPFDARVMFEHDGCEHFEDSGDWGTADD